VHITPALIEASYELLRTTPPFRGWKLPPGDDVEFCVMRNNICSADYLRLPNGTHRIRVNSRWNGSVERVVRAVAHEMVHMHLDIACPSDTAAHGKRFWRAARRVCRHHHFDPTGF
jgi:hypothetical protein